MEKDNSNINIHIRVNKASIKTTLVFAAGLVIILYLTESDALRIGCTILAVLFLVGKICTSSSDTHEDVKNEALKTDTETSDSGKTPNKEEQKPVEKSVVKEIRKPKMPVQNSGVTETKAEEPKVTSEEKSMTKDEWEDFFASFNTDEDND